ARHPPSCARSASREDRALRAAGRRRDRRTRAVELGLIHRAGSGRSARLAAAAEADLVEGELFVVRRRHRTAAIAYRSPVAALQAALERLAALVDDPLVDVARHVVDPVRAHACLT